MDLFRGLLFSLKVVGRKCVTNYDLYRFSLSFFACESS